MTATRDAELVEEERLAKGVYDRLVRSNLRPEDENKYVAVAFDVDDYEIDSDDYAAIDRLLARHPATRIWLTRAGWQAAYRIRATG